MQRADHLPMSKSTLTCGEQFHHTISKRLEDTKYGVVSYDTSLRSVSGKIVTKNYTADIEIHFSPRNLKCQVPRVFCEENWIRRELDWHYVSISKAVPGNVKPFLCWILHHEWNLAHNHKAKRLQLVIEEGSDFLLNNVSKLIEIHWVGHTLGIRHWRDEWNQWLHGKDGVAEYKEEMSKFGHPKNWEIL